MVTVTIELGAILISVEEDKERFKPVLVPDQTETRIARNSFPLGFCFVLSSDSFRQLLQNPNNYIITTDRPNHDVWLQIKTPYSQSVSSAPLKKHHYFPNLCVRGAVSVLSSPLQGKAPCSLCVVLD